MIRRRALAATAALIVVAVLVGGVLLPRIGAFLVEADPPAKADAIVVLAGSYPDRILQAVTLYKQGLAPRILICREPETAGFRRVTELGVTIPRGFDLNRMVAEQLGVPADAIEVLARSGDSTYGEAQVVLAEVMRRGYTSILLVTSKYHTRRAAAIYRFLAGGRVTIIAQPAEYDDFKSEHWWRDRTSSRRLVIEYIKWLNFMLVDRWRLSPATPTPAAT
jgi:uncharacterized SAM-binding protein YcdF (DUF218 family)